MSGIREFPAPVWQPIETAPEAVVVETKIDDGRGVRNVQRLVREGNHWFVSDRSMYVYYTPSHWRLSGPLADANQNQAQKEQG